MRKLLVFLIPVLLGLLFLLAGCGGGGGGSMTPGVTLMVGADTWQPIQGMARNGVSLTAPLDAGAVVTVYDFRTGAVIKSGTVDGSGFCNLQNITTGLTVAIVVTGTRDGKAYRLSTLIANVPNIDTTVVIDPATSLAAEAIAQQYYKQNLLIDQATFDQVLAAAQDYAGANPGADYSLDGSLILGTTFGAAGSLNASELAAVLAAVPDEIDNDIVLAKNAVQQIKEAGFTLNRLLDLPPPDLQSIFTQTVSDNYAALGNRLNLLMLPALFGDMDYYDGMNWYYGVSILDLDTGKAYRVTTNYGGWLEIEDDPAGNTAGQITLSDDTTGPKYTLVAKQIGSSWQLTQTSSADGTLLYRVTFPIVAGETGINPQLTLSISLRDANFPTPLTYQGTISATGAGLESYTLITYNGTLTTPQVTSSGSLEVRFPSTVPAGAAPGATVYDFPSSFSMTGANIVLHGPDYTITLAGGISVATAVVTGGDGYKTIVPRALSLSGGYADTQIGLDFDGELSANWTNPSANPPANTINGTMGLEGTLAREGFPTYAVDLDFTLASGQLTSTIRLQSGAYKLQGTGSGNLTATGDLQNGTLTLTNQAGVIFTLAVDSFGVPTGSVTVNGTQVAAISGGEFGGLKIQYTDGNFEELF